MNADLRDAFSRIKPVCDVLMVCPTADSIAAFISRVTDLRNEVVQELQQYLLFPLITHLNSTETANKHDLQQKLVDSMKMVLEKVTVNSFEMCMKMEIGLLQIVFDSTKQGMIAEIPEELKLSVMNCLTVLLLNVDPKYRQMMLKTHVALLGKAVYVSVHIAKLETFRALKLAAIHCVTAHTATHAQLTTDYQIADPVLERQVVDMLCLILPGVLGALQDVATCPHNPGHALVVAAIDAMHRILCMAMNNKFMAPNPEITTEDFVNMIKEKENKELFSVLIVDPKTLPVRSPAWFNVAGEKLLLVTKSLVSLRTHEHFKVRKELAVFCSRLLFECHMAMQTSVPLALDVLIALSKDDYPEVSEYCTNAINTFFSNATPEVRTKTLDSLCDNLFATLNILPRVMNNIDSSRKLSSLNLIHGYLAALSAESRPQRLTSMLSISDNMECLCLALVQCATVHSCVNVLRQHAVRDVRNPYPTSSHWCNLRHLDQDCERRLQEILRLLGDAECASMVLDRLLELFHQSRDCEIVYICNWMATAPNSSDNLVHRVINTYIEEDVWYLPLEVGSTEPTLTVEETYDITVYNPRAWHIDSVPDLYEGTVETRYTDISYQRPRPRRHAQAQTCASLWEAQRNMVLACLLADGLGGAARRLLQRYQPYLLKTLCLVLERVGSKYELLHLAGLKAIHDIAYACGCESVTDLIKCNADYFTNQVTVRLKKAWNCQSALQILSVVMEYSDSSILNYLYGIVQDVLVQSCDKYYEKDLYAYLQVFLTFVDRIHSWYMIPDETKSTCEKDTSVDVIRDLRTFYYHKEEAERLLNDMEFEKEIGKSVEEMYMEDAKMKEEDCLDYDDTVSEEKPPLPQYALVTITILKRCLNYVVSTQRDNSILALEVLNRGLTILSGYEDELLPLVHKAWGPLASRFEAEPAVMKRAFDLLVTMADLAKDFIRNRAVTDVLPHIYKFLHKSSKDSYLKDVGSAYRCSQAYSLQVKALAALPHLATDLMLEDDALEDAMKCVEPYLSKKQPKPLQSSAVAFFKTILDYDYGAAWYHLRELCNNDEVLTPPSINFVHLQPVVGTPFIPTDKDYEHNINLIFNSMES